MMGCALLSLAFFALDGDTGADGADEQLGDVDDLDRLLRLAGG